MTKLLLTRQDAAETLSMSVDSFEKFVQPRLRLVPQGRLVLVPVTELEKWVRENSALTLEP
jgi:hypothetical protein